MEPPSVPHAALHRRNQQQYPSGMPTPISRTATFERPHQPMTRDARRKVAPYTTVGQFSFAPTTQTTVVTTTTTTTTTFPQLVMKPPRHLNELDPKEYPLAAVPTPANLKRFCFDVDGKPTYFREREDADQSLREVKTSLGACETILIADCSWINWSVICNKIMVSSRQRCVDQSSLYFQTINA